MTESPMPPRRLLVATDFSSGASCAADAAISLAERWNARIDWLHASPKPPQALSPSSDALLTDYVEHEHQWARDGLLALQRQATDRGVESETHWIDGRAEVEVARSAETLESDWVVVGAHGGSAFHSLLVGSVAEKVVRASPVTTLCVRPGAALGPECTIVFGEDFLSPGIRGKAGALAQSLDARLVAVHAVEIISRALANAAFSVPPSVIESTVRDAQERLDELASEYEGDIETTVCLGNASDVVNDTARRHNASLVVCGQSSRSGLERWMLGSVTEKALRYAPCSVLVVK